MQLKTNEAELICKNCKERMSKKYPKMIDCAFLHDNDYCDRIKDIDLLTENLYKELDKQ